MALDSMDQRRRSRVEHVVAVLMLVSVLVGCGVGDGGSDAGDRSPPVVSTDSQNAQEAWPRGQEVLGRLTGFTLRESVQAEEQYREVLFSRADAELLTVRELAREDAPVGVVAVLESATVLNEEDVYEALNTVTAALTTQGKTSPAILGYGGNIPAVESLLPNGLKVLVFSHYRYEITVAGQPGTVDNVASQLALLIQRIERQSG